MVSEIVRYDLMKSTEFGEKYHVFGTAGVS